jgi:8-oxo-dGTP pyrophosphatase MutT (NUDIX family)
VAEVAADRPYAVRGSRERFSGRVISVFSDEVEMPCGPTVVRDYIRHPGAVGIVALDGADQVLLLRQYRHPVRTILWEIPAGLLDVAGEPPLAAARRELHEEGAVTAERWDLLADAFTSPGSSDEAIRIFLARDLQPVADSERFVGEAEEAGMELHWVALDEVVSWVLGGRILNAMCSVGVLAAARARELGWRVLRPADVPWPPPAD